MEDLTTFWDIDEVITHPKLSDEFKINFFQELFGEELTEDNVEYHFKKWRNNNVKSSNVKNILYNDENRELVIQFNDRSVYTYYDVSFETYRDISTGNAAPVTSGENQYGKWERGVRPSVGAGVHQYLINKGVKYKRGGTLR